MHTYFWVTPYNISTMQSSKHIYIYIYGDWAGWCRAAFNLGTVTNLKLLGPLHTWTFRSREKQTDFKVVYSAAFCSYNNVNSNLFSVGLQNIDVGGGKGVLIGVSEEFQRAIHVVGPTEWKAYECILFIPTIVEQEQEQEPVYNQIRTQVSVNQTKGDFKILLNEHFTHWNGVKHFFYQGHIWKGLLNTNVY